MKPIATQELLINEEIRDKEVRLIDEKGEQLGIVKIEHALRIADEKELDLVKIVPKPARLQNHGLRQGSF